MGLLCPRCHGSNFKITDSRPFASSPAVKRKRLCLDCNYAFFTIEYCLTDVQLKIADGYTTTNYNGIELLQQLNAATRCAEYTQEAFTEIEQELMDYPEKKMPKELFTKIVCGALRKRNTQDAIRYLTYFVANNNEKILEQILLDTLFPNAKSTE